MHAFDWPDQTLKIYMQDSTYFACKNDLCRAVLTNLLLSFLPHFSLEKGIWEEWQLQREQKICVLDACINIWLARTNRQNWVRYFPCENDLCRAMLPECLETLPSFLCQTLALEEAIGEYVYDISIFLKWGILNVPFCSIFVPFHFYLVMTLVVPCLDNIFMVCLSLN